jgi:predicted Zn-dependent protease
MRYLITVIILLGCEQEKEPCIETDKTFELYVDFECWPREEDSIKEGVSRLNEMFCKPLVNLAGEVEVNHDDQIIGREVDTVVCYNAKPEWFEDSKYTTNVGSGGPSGLRLFIFNKYEITKDYVLAIVMHELVHYIGVSGHSINYNAVMYGRISEKNTSYKSSDRNMICNVYDCD